MAACDCCKAKLTSRRKSFKRVLCRPCDSWMLAQGLRAEAIKGLEELTDDDIRILIRVLDAIRGFKKSVGTI